MAYNFSLFKERVSAIEEWLRKEVGGIRTGSAAAAILDFVHVESYGAKVPLRRISSISVADAKTLKVSPWDVSQVKDIERGIIAANLGLSVRVDDTGIWVGFPMLTSERRTELIRLVKERFEEAKISIRKEREKILKDCKSAEEKGVMSEDDTHRAMKELQKCVDDANKQLDDVRAKKEKEILA